jgi:3-oxoacyl-[acyl-carrier-protein] synthase-3
MLADGGRFLFSERASAVNPANPHIVAEHILECVRQVQTTVARPGPPPATVHEKFSDLLDSMGMVELLLQLAEDYGTTPEAIEQAANRQYGTIWELAEALAAKVQPRSELEPKDIPKSQAGSTGKCWLVGSAATLPASLQSAEEINERIRRPHGWLQDRAGIQQRCIWDDQDPLSAAADTGRICLERAGLSGAAVGTLLVTSETPPLLLGLAAAIHQRLGLRSNVPALEIGNACTGFLAALWLARDLIARTDCVLIIAVEAASKYLQLKAGPEGDFAALFGDAAAACLLSDRPVGNQPVLLNDIVVGTDGTGAPLLQVKGWDNGSVSVGMMGKALSTRAVRAMAQATNALTQKHGLDISQVAAVISHGGNGRMPALLARQLRLPPGRVWSETADTGNLGSASLPVAWALRGPITGPVLWTAVGAGLTWGAALTGH